MNAESRTHAVNGTCPRRCVSARGSRPGPTTSPKPPNKTRPASARVTADNRDTQREALPPPRTSFLSIPSHLLSEWAQTTSPYATRASPSLVKPRHLPPSSASPIRPLERIIRDFGPEGTGRGGGGAGGGAPSHRGAYISPAGGLVPEARRRIRYWRETPVRDAVVLAQVCCALCCLCLLRRCHLLLSSSFICP
jgi:hypothetical protein